MLHDLRYALRMLRSSPGFTLVAVLSLALGIGANTAIFSLVDAVLLKMLPVSHPEELVALAASYDPGKFGNFAYPEFTMLQSRTRSLTGILASCDFGKTNIFIDGELEALSSGELVSGSYFSVLGVRPYLGRTLTDDDDRSPGSHPVLVISHGYWLRRFAGDPRVLGKTIEIGGTPFAIVGVTPPRFFGVSVGTKTEAWVPLAMADQVFPGNPGFYEPNRTWLELFGRRKPATGEAEVQAELDVLFRQIQAEPTAGKNASERNRIKVSAGGKGIDRLRSRFSQPLLVLMGVVVLVLLIACANVANLLLARAAGREREIAVRMAMGARSGRLIRQVLTESLLLGAAGGAAGVLVAWWSGSLLVRLVSGGHQTVDLALQPDLRILAFTTVICLAATALFGCLPAFRATRVNVNDALKRGAGAVRFGSRTGFGRALVSVQVALSVLLLITAGLFVTTLRNLSTLDTGFQRDHVLVVRISLRGAGYKPEQLPGLYSRLTDHLSAIPGVRSASMAALGFGWGAISTCCISVQGYSHQAGEDRNIRTDQAGPRFFETMGMPILLGRGFTDRDSQDTSKVVVINESMARYYFHDDNPIGKRLGWGEASGAYEIVGVVKDAKYKELRENAPRLIYFPVLQNQSYLSTIVIRTATQPAGLAATVRRELSAVDRNLAVDDIATLSQIVDDTIIQERLTASLSSLFGVLALGLAIVGLYGLMTYRVALRTSEIGIRMALGGQQRDVVWLVMRDVLTLVIAGGALGLVAALGATRVAAAMLYGLSARDPWVFALATGVALSVAVAAGYLPARKASLVDPANALRNE